MAYVKVGTGKDAQQRAKQFPRDADPSAIELWQVETRKALRGPEQAKRTLGADMLIFLSRLSGRRKNDAHGWLKKWVAALGDVRRSEITREQIADQLLKWQAEGYAGASLNRLRQELISLWRELDGPEHRCPARLIPKFKESAPRQGFFETDKLEAVLTALPPHRDVVEFASFSGWRRQEIQGLLWSEVDLTAGVIRLSPERSKTREGRVLPLVGPVGEIITRRAQMQRPTDFARVFWRTEGGKRPGHRETPVKCYPIGDWRKAWHTATQKAGAEGALLHDLRRTVVRNLTRSGVPEKIAMGWTGHKTRSVFDRYNIVSEADLRQAGERLAAHRDKR